MSHSGHVRCYELHLLTLYAQWSQIIHSSILHNLLIKIDPKHFS